MLFHHHVVAQVNLGQGNTLDEGTLTDGENAVGQVDLGQLGATGKGVVADIQDGVGDGHLDDGGQVVEGTVTDLGDGTVVKGSGNNNVVTGGSLTYVVDQDSRLTFGCFKVESAVFSDQIVSLGSILTDRTVCAACAGSKRTNQEQCGQSQSPFIFLPRKNGKTELIAAMLVYFLFMDDEYGAEIYSCANDREQASKVFSAAAAMIRMNKALFKKCKILESQKKIVRLETNSFYKAISADTNTKDGFNAHIVIYDEIHASKNRKLYDLMKTSQGARRQPLFISITTAGVETGTVCHELYEYSKKIIEGVVQDKTFYPVVYEAPEDADIYDEKTWYIANPALGVFRKIEEMRQLAVRAKEIPTAEATFRRLYLNQWVNGEVAWMDMRKWKESDREFDFESIRGHPCTIGVDLSSKIDLTSVNAEFANLKMVIK